VLTVWAKLLYLTLFTVSICDPSWRRADALNLSPEPAGTAESPAPQVYQSRRHWYPRAEVTLPETSPEIAALQEQKAKATHELRVVEEQQDILKFYANSLTGSAVDSESLSQFLDVYASRQLEMYSECHQLKGIVRRLRGEIEDATEVHTKQTTDRRLGTVVVIVLYADRDMDSNLEFVYNVQDAYWTPHLLLKSGDPRCPIGI
jgi:hypothetical protein